MISAKTLTQFIAVVSRFNGILFMSAALCVRHDWTRDQILALFNLPFNDLLFRAHSVHRQHFDPNQVQVSTLCSIKTVSPRFS